MCEPVPYNETEQEIFLVQVWPLHAPYISLPSTRGNNEVNDEGDESSEKEPEVEEHDNLTVCLQESEVLTDPVEAADEPAPQPPDVPAKTASASSSSSTSSSSSSTGDSADSDTSRDNHLQNAEADVLIPPPDLAGAMATVEPEAEQRPDDDSRTCGMVTFGGLHVERVDIRVHSSSQSSQSDISEDVMFTPWALGSIGHGYSWGSFPQECAACAWPTIAAVVIAQCYVCRR